MSFSGSQNPFFSKKENKKKLYDELQEGHDKLRELSGTLILSFLFRINSSKENIFIDRLGRELKIYNRQNGLSSDRSQDQSTQTESSSSDSYRYQDQSTQTENWTVFICL